jgi:hypothetical protein
MINNVNIEWTIKQYICKLNRVNLSDVFAQKRCLTSFKKKNEKCDRGLLPPSRNSKDGLSFIRNKLKLTANFTPSNFDKKIVKK